MKKLIFFAVIVLLLGQNTAGQDLTKDYKPSAKFAEYCLKFGNYPDGMREFKLLLQESPEKISWHMGMAVCYLNMNVDKEKALEELLWVTQQKNVPAEAYYLLGMACLQLERLDEAEDALGKYLKSGSHDEHDLDAGRLLAMVKNARKAIKNPVNVEVANLGKYVNTKNAEYFPFVPANESMLLFNSERKSNLGNFRFYDGKYPSDIYRSVYKFDKWKKAKRMSVVNSFNIDRIVGMTSDGAMIFIMREDVDGHRELLYSRKRGRYYRSPQPVFINGENYKTISSLTISPDGRFLVFSARHKNGLGGKDLYVSKRLPDGEWSEARMLDSVTNTPWDEDFPYFSPDGRHFFFASQGHNSMGGYDIFKTRWSVDSTFHLAKPENLGYPVNTTLDDLSISLSMSGRYGYISSFRAGGFGDLDIYRVVFKDVNPRYSVVAGVLLNADSIPFITEIKRLNDHIDTLNFPVNREYKRLLLKKKDSAAAYKVLAGKIPYEKVDVNIEAVDMATGKSFGKWRARNDNGHYAVILPPGHWKLIFNRKGYKTIADTEVLIEERDQRNRLLRKNVKLIKQDRP